jgi:hypothetical protein
VAADPGRTFELWRRECPIFIMLEYSSLFQQAIDFTCNFGRSKSKGFQFILR